MAEDYSELATKLGTAAILYGSQGIIYSRKSSMNAGQNAIMENGQLDLDLDITHYDLHFDDETAHGQNVNVFDFQFQVGHEEPVSETIELLNYCAEVAKSQMEYPPTPDRTAEEAAHEALTSYISKVGYFV